MNMQSLISSSESYALAGNIEATMTKQMLADVLARHRATYAQAGGTITQCPMGARMQVQDIDPLLVHCECGCKGDYTEHSMRLGESGL